MGKRNSPIVQTGNFSVAVIAGIFLFLLLAGISVAALKPERLVRSETVSSCPALMNQDEDAPVCTFQAKIETEIGNHPAGSVEKVLACMKKTDFLFFVDLTEALRHSRQTIQQAEATGNDAALGAALLDHALLLSLTSGPEQGKSVFERARQFFNSSENVHPELRIQFASTMQMIGNRSLFQVEASGDISVDFNGSDDRSLRLLVNMQMANDQLEFSSSSWRSDCVDDLCEQLLADSRETGMVFGRAIALLLSAKMEGAGGRIRAQNSLYEEVEKIAAEVACPRVRYLLASSRAVKFNGEKLAHSMEEMKTCCRLAEEISSHEAAFRHSLRFMTFLASLGRFGDASVLLNESDFQPWFTGDFTRKRSDYFRLASMVSLKAGDVVLANDFRNRLSQTQFERERTIEPARDLNAVSEDRPNNEFWKTVSPLMIPLILSTLVLLTAIAICVVGLQQGRANALKTTTSPNNRMAMRRFAAGVADHFNNLLTAIMFQAEMLRLRSGKNPEIEKYSSRILETAEEAAIVSRKVLAYTGRQYLRSQSLDLAEMAAKITSELSEIVPDVRLEFQSMAEGVRVSGDPDQIDVMIRNLVRNACENSQPGGDVIVMVDRCATGPYDVFLDVRDNGPGLDSNAVRSMFDPFFSNPDSSRGLNMAEVEGIARAHNGTIDVRSVPGDGTNIRVGFPRRNS